LFLVGHVYGILFGAGTTIVVRARAGGQAATHASYPLLRLTAGAKGAVGSREKANGVLVDKPWSGGKLRDLALAGDQVERQEIGGRGERRGIVAHQRHAFICR